MSQDRFTLHGRHAALAALIVTGGALFFPASARSQPAPLLAPERSGDHVASSGRSLFPLDARAVPFFRSLDVAPPETVDALLARVEERLNTHPDEALHLAEEALLLAQRTGDKNGEAQSLRMIGNIHFRNDRLGQALDHLARAQRLFESTEDQAALVGVLNRIGDIHTRRGDLPHALRAHLEALDLCEELGNEEGVAQAFNSIGYVYHRQKNAAQAIRYFRQAVRLHRTLEDPRNLALSYSNLGAALLDAGAYDEALVSLRRTLSFSERTKDSVLTAVASNNAGVALNRSGRPTQALEHLHKALRMSEETGFNHLAAATFDELARAYLTLGDLDRALRFARRSLAMGVKTKDVVWIQNAHEVLSSIHAARGEYEQAYVNHRRYSAMKDSLFDVEKAEIISRMQTRHELEGMEQQIESLHQQNRIRSLQAQQRQNVLLGGLGVLVLVVGFSFNRYRLKQKANRLLTAKNAEIGRQREALRENLEEKSLMLEEKDLLVREIHHRVKNNLQLLSSMLRLQAQTLQSPAALAALQDMQARVLSMSLLHRELYGEENATHVEMQGYIETLSRFLLRAFNADGRVRCPVHAHDTQLNADTAVPLGLILSELLSNALKHAFPDERQGVVRVDLRRTEIADGYELTVSDDGVGWAEEAPPEKPATVGLTMVRVMTRQLRGTAQQTNGVGLTHTIRFKAKEGRA